MAVLGAVDFKGLWVQVWVHGAASWPESCACCLESVEERVALEVEGQRIASSTGLRSKNAAAFAVLVFKLSLALCLAILVAIHLGLYGPIVPNGVLIVLIAYAVVFVLVLLATYMPLRKLAPKRAGCADVEEPVTLLGTPTAEAPPGERPEQAVLRSFGPHMRQREVASYGMNFRSQRYAERFIVANGGDARRLERIAG